MTKDQKGYDQRELPGEQVVLLAAIICVSLFLWWLS